MQIQVSTDHNIEGREALSEHFKGVVATALDRFRGRITRVEVHLSDQNGNKAGPDDKRCTIEARLEGHQPTAVSHQAATVDKAVHGATDKLKRSLDGILRRLNEHR